jgi:Protein of unknown function (DUF1553)/Protein of unknown function (DUF1549)/Concanavalin A-like lectin/glucanases superfamily/Planctomycete cytochrome C
MIRVAAVSVILVGATLHAAEPPIDFARDVRPILSHHCWTCHGPDEKARKAGLRLDDRDLAVKKKAIVPHDLKASKIVGRIDDVDEDRQMPPPESKRPLSDRQKQILKAWIEQGAKYSQHWAFTVPQRPIVPGVRETQSIRNAIDNFIRQRLEAAGMAPALEADRATLIRRVTLDLTGLPPTPAEVETFVADKSPDAYERLVDRLLASPRYAERMAMAWLDAARFADTNGFNNDEDRTQWPWRDWLIDAFAHNKPFDRFLVEQLAGDLLPNPTLDQRVATAFLRNQVHNTEGGIIPEEYRVEYVADRVHTTATVFLGLSMQCARCHDHKYDPISQREYYQFFGFFQNIADRQASYANFIGAEPYIRVPTADQRAKLAGLQSRRNELENGLKEREIQVDAAVAAWERGLTAADRKKLAGAGLLLRVPLDEATGTAVATSDPALKGIVRGTAKWSTGKVGGAIDCDGKTWVEIAAGNAPDGDTPFSVSIWAYPTTNGLYALASKMDDGAGHRGWDVLLENGRVSSHLVHRWPDNGLKVLTREAMAPNAWHHVLVTHDGSKKGAGVHIYVDGKPQTLEITTDTLRDTTRTEKPLHIGRRGASLPFQGKLDDVQLFGLALTAENAVQLAQGQAPDLADTLLAVPVEKRTAAQIAQVRRFYVERIDTEYARLKRELVDTNRQLVEMEKAQPVLMVMEELPKTRELFVLNRGQYDRPGEKVTVGVPGVFPALGATLQAANRLDLANWLVDPQHPLTARVAVNRWWQSYFGTGLVKTVEDFGITGEYPSHPELLDWLATELIRTGWDVKAMQRLIVTSATYRQDSRMSKEALERDPENRLLARGPRYRLSAEGVRDNALAVSGLLVERTGGPSVKPYQPPGLWEDVTVERRGKYVADKGDGLYRRSMYTFWKRTCPPPGLMTFDAPNREVCVARRATTNTPLQALVLLNDPTYVEAARTLAERMWSKGANAEARLAIGFQHVLARTPTADESRILLEIQAEALARYRADPAAAKKLLDVGDSRMNAELNPSEWAAWATVASIILNLDETITKR